MVLHESLLGPTLSLSSCPQKNSSRDVESMKPIKLLFFLACQTPSDTKSQKLVFNTLARKPTKACRVSRCWSLNQGTCHKHRKSIFFDFHRCQRLEASCSDHLSYQVSTTLTTCIHLSSSTVISLLKNGSSFIVDPCSLTCQILKKQNHLPTNLSKNRVNLPPSVSATQLYLARQAFETGDCGYSFPEEPPFGSKLHVFCPWKNTSSTKQQN